MFSMEKYLDNSKHKKAVKIIALCAVLFIVGFILGVIGWQPFLVYIIAILVIVAIKLCKRCKVAAIIAGIVGAFFVYVLIKGSISMPIQNAQGNAVADTEQYIQSNYPDFKDCKFEDSTVSVDAMDNSEYVVNGEMKDNGGWKHSVKSGVQISPNEQKFIMCYLFIDGQQYVWNAPRQNVNSSNPNTCYNSNYADGAQVTVVPDTNSGD